MPNLEELRKNYPELKKKLKKTQGANSQNIIPEIFIWPATLSLIHKSKRGCITYKTRQKGVLVPWREHKAIKHTSSALEFTKVL